VALERYRPRVRVEIDGGGRTVLGGSCTLGTRAAFGTATLVLDPTEGRPTPGQTVRIWAGYDASLQLVFTGEIDAGGVALAPNELEIRCTGILSRTRERIGEPPTIVDGEAEQEYFLTWEAATASTIIADILDAYGITDYTLEDSAMTFGNIEPVGLMASDSGWSLIEQLDEVEGYRTFDAPDGSARRLQASGIPAGSGVTFEQGVDLFAGRLDESRTGTYNRVIVSGLPQVGSTGVDFVPTEELSAPSPWIPTPPTYRAFTWSSFLFETAEDCGVYAARKLGELNRLRGELPFDLALGDATLRPGMSVAVDSLILDVRANVRFWLIEVTHDFGGGFNTSGVLLMASEGTGWSPNLAPVAIIDAHAKQETLADGTEIVTVSLDGSASYDPELGVAGIVSYNWGGVPVDPTAFDSAMRATALYEDGIPDGAWISLTVTDNLGKTGTAKIYPAENGLPLKQRDLISAELTRLQTTRDGGATWNSVQVAAADIAAVGTCEFAAAEYTFAWTAAGALYKVLADDTATLVAGGIGANITACGITLTNGDPDLPTGRVWAATSAGAVYRSTDHGATWEARASAPNGGEATYILESPFAEGDVELAAGNAYYRSFDNGGAWTAQFEHPNTALVARRVASGFGQGWVGFSGGAAADGGESRIQERDDAVDLDFDAGDKPASVFGLALDPFENVLYALDVDSGGLGRAWVGDGAAGGLVAAAATWNDASWGVPRHMIRDGTSPGYLYIAANSYLLKSVDGLASIMQLKLVGGGGAAGRMLGYGAERARQSGFTVASEAGQGQCLSLWDGSANDDPPAGWYAAEYDATAWAAPVEPAATTAPPLAGTEAIWSEDLGVPGPSGRADQVLFRRAFALPPGAVSAARLRVTADNTVRAAYVNGVIIGGGITPGTAVDDSAAVATVLLPGRTNTIAVWAENSGFEGWASFRLDVNGGA
jgi:hypothetical protein